MSEELRVLLRNAVYLLSSVIVYWFVSYEWAGTAMMLVLGIAALGFVGIASSLIRSTHPDLNAEYKQADRRERMLSLPTRLFGFDEPEGGHHVEAPLEIAEGEMPHGSVWPLVASVGLVTVGIGFIYGTWFYVIGIGVGIWGTWGWVTQLLPPPATLEPNEHPDT